MDNENNSILLNNIHNYLEHASYTELYSYDIAITILSIFFVLLIILYLNINSRIKLEKQNWESNKCNPFHMMFGSTIHGTDDKFDKQNL